MYNYVNRPWRTQELVDSVYRSQYANAVDGLSGNEDCGQMSAWYVLNSMGFYQVCPGNMTLNGKPLDKPFFTHDDIIAGSTLEIEMTDRRTQP